MTRTPLTHGCLAGALVLIVLLLLTPGSVLSDEGPERAARDAAEEQVQAKPLDEAKTVRRQGNAEGVASQKRIDEISAESETLFALFSNTLRQIDSIRIYNDQMRQLITSQETEFASLADQLGRVELVGRSVTPLMLRMIDALEKFVALDVPFLLDEREGRVAELHRMMKRADVTGAEKYRQIMEAYQIENEFGRTIESYRGTIDLDGRETTVDFLRFGRIALVYQSLDATQSGAWNQSSRSWMPLDSTYRSAIRNGLRIARKQSAPDLIRLPLPAGNQARGS